MNQGKGRIIDEQDRFKIIIERLCYELIEDYDTFENTCIIGIQPKGSFLADRIKERLTAITGDQVFDFGKLDITFYRDDFRRREKPLSPSKTEINFIIEGKSVLLIDDVVYTGRTIRAALTALDHFGRPGNVHLLSLVDRRFNRQMPIMSDYTGVMVDALDEAYVKVEWDQNEGEDKIILFSDKKALS